MKCHLFLLVFMVIISFVNGFMKLQKRKFRPLKWSKKPVKLPVYGGRIKGGYPYGAAVGGFPTGGYRQRVYRGYYDDDNDDDDPRYYIYRPVYSRRVGYGFPRTYGRKGFGYSKGLRYKKPKKPYLGKYTFPSYGLKFGVHHGLRYGYEKGHEQKFGQYRQPFFRFRQRCLCQTICPLGTHAVRRCPKYKVSYLCCPVNNLGYWY